MFQLIDALYSYNINPISTRNSRRDVPPVRAMLVALDQCGFRTVVVEKTQPGPFGFYIATGVMNGQRGGEALFSVIIDESFAWEHIVDTRKCFVGRTETATVG